MDDITRGILIGVGIVSYILMIAFNCGFWWRKWKCVSTSGGDDEMGVAAFSFFWIVTVPVYLMWKLGGYLVNRFGG